MSTCYQKTLRHSVSSAWYNWDVYFGELKDRIRQPFSKLTLFLCKEKDFHSSLLTGFDDEVHILIFSIFFKQKYFLENDVLQNSKYRLNQPDKILEIACENVRFKEIFRLLFRRFIGKWIPLQLLLFNDFVKFD